jgi:NAD(P)-dependent dehydrogenase (short-subunit alcohol dehydrogenase family)
VQIQEALPHLRKSHGRIVLVSSGAAVKAYPSWGAYGASKAALNHLVITLQAEEPEVTTIALRPGVVDTQMQTDLRGKFYSSMDKEVADDFVQKHISGSLLKPEQPGNIMARLVINGGKELSGKFLRCVEFVDII